MRMRSRAILFAAYTLCLLAIGASVAQELITLSLGNETASHVLLVPLVTVVLIYHSRKSIFSSVRTAVPAGVPVILVGLVTLLLARSIPDAIGNENLLSLKVGGLVVAWVGGFVLFYGGEAFRAARFPILFLGFTIPIPPVLIDGATLVLKTGSTKAVAGLFTLTGTPYFREGFVFSLPNLVIEVADECSGIRSTIALVMTVLLAGHTFLMSPWTKALVVLAILPITVFKNGVRIVALSLLAMHVDPGFLTGQLHHDGGIVFFLLGLAMLAPVFVVLRRAETLKPEATA
jgi:exosortase